MRLIDADALIKRCMNGIDNEFIGIVNEIPTVKVLDKIRAEIDEQIKYNTYFNSDMAKGEIIAFEWVKRKIDEYTKGEGE